MKVRKPELIVAARYVKQDRQIDVATATGVSQQYISRVENGTATECSRQFARSLSKYLKLSMTEVFEDAPQRSRIRPSVDDPRPARPKRVQKARVDA